MCQFALTWSLSRVSILTVIKTKSQQPRNTWQFQNPSLNSLNNLKPKFLTRSQSRVSISTFSKPKSGQLINSRQLETLDSLKPKSWHSWYPVSTVKKTQSQLVLTSRSPGLQRIILLRLFTLLHNWNIHDKNKQFWFTTTLPGYRVIHLNLTSFKLYVWPEYKEKGKQPIKN